MKPWFLFLQFTLLHLTVLGFFIPSRPSKSSSTITMNASLRILALHGSEGTASSLQIMLQGLLPSCDITTIQAPFPKGTGYAWWRLGPGERSFTATTYMGYEESAALVTQTLQKKDFDVILGHSQGAILLVAMIADGKLSSSSSPSSAPPQRILLNGVAWPNPFTTQLLSDNNNNNNNKDWSHLNVMQIIGVQDRINPPEQALRVEEALRHRGCQTTVLHHPGGHSLPSDKKIWSLVSDWMEQKISLDPVLFVENESK